MSRYSGERNDAYLNYPHNDKYIDEEESNEPPVDYQEFHIKIQDEDEDNSDLDSTGKTRTFARLCGRFADKTSMQGVGYINSAKLGVAKVLWAILLVISIGWMTAHLYYLIDQFLGWDVQTKITLGFSNLPLPAVTLCNVNIIRRSQFNHASPPLKYLYAITDPSRFDPKKNQSGKKRKKRFVSDFKNVNFDNFTDYGDYYEDLEDDEKDALYELEETFRELYMEMDRDTRVEMGHQMDQMLLSCSFNGIPCYSENFTLIQTKEYGNCYMLNTQHYLAQDSGPNSGLSMILYTENYEYLDGINQGYGLRVAIHEPGTYPLPTDHGIYVSAASETHVGLKLTNITRKGGRYGNCTDGEAFKQLYGITYSRQVCRLLCQQTKLLEECGCFQDAEEELLLFAKRKKIKICRKKSELQCQDKILRNYRKKSASCSCESPCSETQYSFSSSSRQWPTDAYATILMQAVCDSLSDQCDRIIQVTDPRELNLNFIKLVVYYEDLNYQSIAEEPEIEVQQFASDVGGAIGLWIGLSILSIFEIFQLLVELFAFCVHKCKRSGNRSDKKKKEKKKPRQPHSYHSGKQNAPNQHHYGNNFDHLYSNWNRNKY